MRKNGLGNIIHIQFSKSCLLYFAYGDMKNRNLEDCVRQGRQYRDMVAMLKDAYEKEQIDAITAYFLFEKRNDFLKQISIYYYNNKSVSFTTVQLQEILHRSNSSNNDTKLFLMERIKEMSWYDKYICVPASKITTARLYN